MEQAALKANPLGTERIGKLMVRFAVPSIVAPVLNSLYNMVDQVFIGNGVGYQKKSKRPCHAVRVCAGQAACPVFPAGIILETDDGRIKARIFFEIMAKEKNDASVETVPKGIFLCRRLDLEQGVRLTDAIGAICGDLKKRKAHRGEFSAG